MTIIPLQMCSIIQLTNPLLFHIETVLHFVFVINNTAMFLWVPIIEHTEAFPQRILEVGPRVMGHKLLKIADTQACCIA